jgi:predicted GIY-YIG superfamily endonuclease
MSAPRPRTSGTVYLLHFEPSYRHAGHYLGFAQQDVRARLAEHQAGRGARLTQVAIEAGCALILARTWPDSTRHDERRRKGRSLRPLCPLCQQQLTLPMEPS